MMDSYHYRVESQGYFIKLGHTHHCHSDLSHDEYELALPVLLKK